MPQGSLALHGFELLPPTGWEVAGVSGHAGDGWLLLARQRTPVVRVAWRRRALAADAQRTLTNLGKDLQRRHGCGALAVRSQPHPDALAGTWDGTDGAWHAAVRASQGVTLTAVALVPAVPVADLMGTAQIHGADEAWPWRLHGLDVLLPPWWRLTGVQHFAGLVRALWQHQNPAQRRPDAVLVLRRLACASRVLAGTTRRIQPVSAGWDSSPSLKDWLTTGVDRRDTITRITTREDGVVHLVLTRPPAAWWWRWRGHQDQREVWGWIDEAADRLTVQEWRGSGEPLPCLNRQASAALVGA